MLKKKYFYRRFGSSDFLPECKEKKIIPVRLKNNYIPDTIIFNNEKKLWEKSEKLPEENIDQQPEEFVEFPFNPVKPHFVGNSIFNQSDEIDLEDLSPCEMKDYFDWKKEQSRFFVNSKYYKDSNNISKDYIGAEIITDTKNLTLTLSFIKFERKELDWKNQWNYPEKSFAAFPCYSNDMPFEPETTRDTFFCDMKNGIFSENFINQNDNYYDFYNDSKNASIAKHDKLLRVLKDLETKAYPKSVLKEAYKELCRLAKLYTGLEKTPSVSNMTEDNKEARFLTEMYYLTMLPCEPRLFVILKNKEFDSLKIKFKYRRNDTKVLNKFLKKTHINGYRILRKAYAETPLILLTYRRLHDAGFRDVNLYNRIIQNKENYTFINSLPREAFVFFSKYCIKHRGQLVTLNLILKQIERDDFDQDDFAFYDQDDAFSMFQQYFHKIPKELKKDILKDGFTRFNHDALSNLSYQVSNKKIVFKYSEEQKNLEDEIDGYSFRLPQTSYQLCEIGTSLHNCVASYAETVQKNECTIVYATKDNNYKICIEVRGKEYIQERIDRNAQPGDEEKIILQKWHERHGLKGSKSV